MFKCVKPAFFSDSNLFDRTMPFVVIANSFKSLRADSLSVKKNEKNSSKDMKTYGAAIMWIISMHNE